MEQYDLLFHTENCKVGAPQTFKKHKLLGWVSLCSLMYIFDDLFLHDDLQKENTYVEDVISCISNSNMSKV